MALLGYHFHSYGSGQTYAGMMQRLASTGGGAARLDTNWSDYQTTPQANSFNANSASLTGVAYDNYLISRGYLSAIGNTPSLYWPYSSLLTADQNNINTIFNFGVNPTWAQGSGGASSLANPAYVGQFLADFIVYISKQPTGIEVLKNITGWQFFNEANTIYGTQPGMLPYTDYFQAIDNALALTKQAYASINWNTVAQGIEPPDVIAPALGGVYDANFWNAFLAYTPTVSAANAQGHLALDAISLHPYGNRIDAWTNPFTGGGADTTNIMDNPTYARIIMPTDDRLTWEAMVARDIADNSVNYNLYTYASRGSLADEYFDQNSEIGVERTMAKLSQAGYSGLEVNFTEWGASTYVGNLADGLHSLWNTTFADPFKYGNFAPGTLLSQAVAENLQAETVVQTIGLIESWDFVTNATVYEIFDQATTGYFNQYGIAYYALDANGNPVFKPSGLAHNAYMAGTEYHKQDILGAGSLLGVDIHIAGAGVAGSFNNALRDTTANEIILMRQGDDTVSGGNGDDTIFGGDGNDIVTGDAGWDKLYGGFGNDNLNGGNNADKIKGDAGDDTLTGGTGADEFMFSAFGTTGSGNAGTDTITDFNVAEDKLTIVGGYSAADMLNNTANPNLIQDVAGGVRIYYADNGASIFLQGLTEAQLSANIFHSLEVDTTVGYAAPGGSTINGTAGADTLNGTTAADTINGLAGDDALFGLGGNDILNGGDNNDWLIGGAGADTIDGGLGWDLVDYFDSASAVTVNLLTGTGIGGDAQGDVISNVETLGGSAFNDTLTGDAGFNNIFASAGNDVLDGGGSDDMLDGAAGNDSLFGGLGNDNLLGGDNDDWLVGGAGADTMNGGAGWDLVDYYNSTAAVTVSLLAGTGVGGDAQGDVISNVEALGGSAFNDTLTGDPGFNNIFGSGGSDIMDGGASDDMLDAGAGDDQLNGNTGNDNMFGGIGNDTFFVDSTLDIVNENLNEGTDVVQSTVTIVGLAANVENLTLAGTGIINGTGNTLNNVLTGNAVANSLSGLAGNDTLSGAAGADIINGGAGADSLTGGTQSNTFTFAAGDTGQVAGTLDTLTDYAKGAVGTGDKIDYTSVMTIGGSAAAATATQAAINMTTGIASFAAGSGTTLADALGDIATRFTAATNSVGEVAFFKVNATGNYLMFISDGTAGVTANDIVIQTNLATIGSLNFTSGDITILT